ncbi:hypothetical protein KAI54_01825 [Candidatus Gracilibacteria bacterium]|nr:hypothetical protein [Candidatus Gracilibacteria bacterium]
MIFLSIKPRYAEAIKRREKFVEFRKKTFNRSDVKYCVVYASSPQQKVIGYFKIKCIVRASPKNLWQKYRKLGAISKKEFDLYFRGKKEAYAIIIAKFEPLENPIAPRERIKNFNIPQSFCYLSEKESFSLLGACPA